MSLLKRFCSTTVNEDAAGGAVGAGAIAANPGRVGMMITRLPTNKRRKSKSAKNKSLFAYVSEAAEQFDHAAILAQLKAVEKKDAVGAGRPIVSFGIEDNNKQLVKVSVPAEQAQEFERALEIISADAEREGTEIAELLYNLKDQFDIVDVEWPEVEEDEEVEQDLSPEEQSGEDIDVEDVDSEEGDMEAEVQADTSPTDDTASLLTQVIDMMKADAAARQADANARIADAKAREQELAMKQTLVKVKHEEELLDMADYQKRQKDQDREAKRLAQLAKWKRDMDGSSAAISAPPAQQIGMDDTSDVEVEDEEKVVNRTSGKMSAADFARRLMGK